MVSTKAKNSLCSIRVSQTSGKYRNYIGVVWVDINLLFTSYIFFINSGISIFVLVIQIEVGFK